MKKIMVAGMLWALSLVCHAGCNDLLVGQRSYHTDKTYEDDGKRYDYNNINYLLGCLTDEGHVIAFFENSYEDPALLLGHKWEKDIFSSYVTPYLVLGVAMGYKDHMEHIGAFSPYGFVGIDIHPADKRYGLMISTVGVTTTIGVRFALK